MTTGATDCLEWAVAARPLPGQFESGDRAVVSTSPSHAVIAVIDGLGHGSEAAEAAVIAAATIEGTGTKIAVGEIIRACHEALRSTRGAVISAVRIELQTDIAEWIGIGNVETMLVRLDASIRRRETALLIGGIVGYSIPVLRPSTLGLSPGDAFVLATDGVRSSFGDDVSATLPARQTADLILSRHARPTDDALVLVARYLGVRR